MCIGALPDIAYHTDYMGGIRRSYKLAFGLFLILVLFGAGFATDYYLNNRSTAKAANLVATHPLIAKRVFVDNPNDVIINFTSLRNNLHQELDPITSQYSFYFEYLPTGTSIRINGETQLVAASLVKLPLVMDLFRAFELGRLQPDATATLTKDDLDPSFGDLYKKGAGYQLTLGDASDLALTQSDNTADRVINRSLTNILAPNEESLPNLDVDYDTSIGGQAVISARGYSSILKCLYLSCYLMPNDSQEILSELTKTPFNDALTRDIPKNVVVAHKIGVFVPNGTFSDCGIFYVPKRPYLLCMLMQEDQTTADQTMADTSKQIYDWITTRVTSQ